jgi:acetyl esterase/lipase
MSQMVPVIDAGIAGRGGFATMRSMRAMRAVLLGALVFVAAGCEHLVIPEGDAPLRYRDAVFSEVDVTEDIHYRTAVDQEGDAVDLVMDLYQPVGDTVDERPMIVYVHGGAFRGGNENSPELVDQAHHFARLGYVVGSISYRLNDPGCTSVTVACLTAIVHAREDAQAAVEFVRDNAAGWDVDTDRIAIGGTSAGAITAVNVAFSTVERPAAGVGAAVSLSGASIGTTPNPGDAPVLLFHGTEDGLVPYQSAVNTKSAADEAGVRAVLNTWEGAGHVPYVTFRDQILDRTRNFLYFHLDLASADQ